MLSASLSDDAADVLARAGQQLERDPVRHNVILTLLRARAMSSQPGRYWTVWSGSQLRGLVFQSPLDFEATVTPMKSDAVSVAVDAVVAAGVRLPGISGEAATVARFAGVWTERTGGGARPYMGQRIYEVGDVIPPSPITGACRPATPAEVPLVAGWLEAFATETGESTASAAEVARRRTEAGELFVWDDGAATSVAGISSPVADTVRVGPVFTPVEGRRRGRGTALVAAVSAAARDRGHRCTLYTDLGNATSNGIYRSLGYRAVMEALKYRLDPA